MNSYYDALFALRPPEEEESNVGDDDITGVRLLTGGQSSFHWEDKKLVVKVPKINKDDLPPDLQQPLEMLGAFLNNPTYELRIHLPSKVKKVSHPDAKVENRQTVVLTMPADELFEQDLEFTILTK